MGHDFEALSSRIVEAAIAGKRQCTRLSFFAFSYLRDFVIQLSSRRNLTTVEVDFRSLPQGPLEAVSQCGNLDANFRITEPTLADRLKGQRYATALIGKWRPGSSQGKNTVAKS